MKRPKRLQRFDKLPKRRVTIDELLDRVDIQEIKDEVATLDTDELFVFYVKDGVVYWLSNMITSRIIYQFECIKLALLGE